MRVLVLVHVQCSTCASTSTLADHVVEAGAVCLFCGGTFTETGRKTKTFGHGLCDSGKYRYDTRCAADRASGAFLRKARRHLEVYRCASCTGWHLGSAFERRKAG